MRLRSLNTLITAFLLLAVSLIAIIVLVQVKSEENDEMSRLALLLRMQEFQLIQEVQSLIENRQGDLAQLNAARDELFNLSENLVGHVAGHDADSSALRAAKEQYLEVVRANLQGFETNIANETSSASRLASDLPAIFSLPGAKRLSLDQRQYVLGYLVSPSLEGWQMIWHMVKLTDETNARAIPELDEFVHQLELYDSSLSARQRNVQQLQATLDGSFALNMLEHERQHFANIATLGKVAAVCLAVLIAVLLAWAFRGTLLANRAREELAASNRELDQKVRDATAQLVEKMADLEQQKLRAEDATKAKSEFLANMSHEIRTPLNGINGMAQILQRSNITNDQRSQVETILTSTGSLAQIINDILDFSKIEAGKIELETMDFSLLQLVESTVDQITLLANKAENQLVIHYSSLLPEFVHSDPSRIRQIMLNLLSNANKFTSKGVIDVRAEHVERMGEQFFKVSIKDSGIGISEDKLAHIFEAFSQEDASTTRKFGGTGLGLTICKRLAQLMDGDIGVTSKQGEGSTFSFYLPLVKAASPEREERKGPLRHIKPMIFDNNDIRRRAMCKQLESWNLESAVFGDVSEFLLALQQLDGNKGIYHDISCIIVNMDDYKQALGEALRKLSKDIPKLFLTPLYSEDFGEFDRTLFSKEVRSPIKPSEFLDALADAHSNSVGEKYAAPEDQTNSFRGRTVLLVDDNEINRMVAELMITGFAAEVVMAEDGREAVNKVLEQDFDLVFMDCQMPVMDGYEASQAIRQLDHPVKKLVPIIAMTANAMKGDREVCLEAGMDDYIAKPVEANELYSLMEKWLGHTHSEGIAARE